MFITWADTFFARKKTASKGMISFPPAVFIIYYLFI